MDNFATNTQIGRTFEISWDVNLTAMLAGRFLSSWIPVQDQGCCREQENDAQYAFQNMLVRQW
jgi:hypothetical protein